MYRVLNRHTLRGEGHTIFRLIVLMPTHCLLSVRFAALSAAISSEIAALPGNGREASEEEMRKITYGEFLFQLRFVAVTRE